MRFVGYSLTQKGYRLYDENRRKIFIRRDVTFNETDFGSSKASQMKFDEDCDEYPGEDVAARNEEPLIGSKQSEESSSGPRHSERTRNPPVHYHDEYAGLTTARHTALYVSEVEEPATLKEALDSEHSEQWKAAADAEYQSLMENETWDLVQLAADRKPIKCKWGLQSQA